MSKTIHRTCPACGRDNRHSKGSKYSKNDWKIIECAKCHFVYLENAPAYESLVKDFAWEKTSEIEKAERRAREPVKQFASTCLRFIKEHLLKRDKLPKLINKHFKAGNVLDIGCAFGFVLCMLDEKYVPYGIEISEKLAEEGNQNLRSTNGYVLKSDACSGLRTFKENFFDGIIMSAFLEHEIEPLELFKGCLRTLKDDGKLIIKVPNYGCINRVIRGSQWCGFRYPDHVNYFTPKTLKKLCEDAGFAIHQFGFLDRHPLSDNMWIVTGKTTAS